MSDMAMDSPAAPIKVGVCFLARKRPGFDPQWAQTIEAAAREQLASGEFDVFVPEVRIVDEGTLRSALEACIQAGVEVVAGAEVMAGDEIGLVSSLMRQKSRRNKKQICSKKRLGLCRMRLTP